MLKQTNQAIGDRQEAASKSKVNLVTLHKALYVAAMECVADRFKGDPDEIKAVRDAITYSLFERNYKDLTRDELIVAIDVLNQRSSKVTPVRASISQSKLLRLYQLHCACVYADWEDYWVKDEQTGKILKGDAVRNVVIGNIEKNLKIQRNIFSWMHETWINPTSHEFMLEGNRKKSVKNPKNFHYEFLSPDDANYLIQRFCQMFMALSKTGRFDFDNKIGLN